LCVLFVLPTPRPEPRPLSLHDALPIFPAGSASPGRPGGGIGPAPGGRGRPLLPDSGGRRPARSVGLARPGPRRGTGRTTPGPRRDRKSTRLNSSHLVISYAVFCLKKKK